MRKVTYLRKPKLPPVGLRVRLTGDHPWAGNEGVVEAHDHSTFFRRTGARVLLDNGMHAGIVENHTDEWEAADEHCK